MGQQWDKPGQGDTGKQGGQGDTGKKGGEGDIGKQGGGMPHEGDHGGEKKKEGDLPR